MALESRRGRRRGLVIAAVVVFFIVVASSARFFTDILWFQEVGFQSVLWKSLATQATLGIAVGVVVGSLVWINLLIAARVAPAYRVPRFEVIGRADPMDRYRESLTPFLKWLRLGVAVFLGIVVGASASSAWQTFLLWVNRTDFGRVDPQFERDIGFYVFELPWFDLLLSWVWAGLLITLLLTVAAHYFHGSIRPEAGLAGVTSGALAHISVLLGFVALVKAGRYWLGTFQLNFSARGVVTGASYTDVNAHLPALNLLAIVSVISAVLFLVNIRVRRFALPLAAVGMWILVSVLAGGVWPWWVQRFSVAPQEPQREQQFIGRNIEATREAFGLDAVETRPFPATPGLSSREIEANESMLDNVRLWDTTALQLAYSQLQAIRTYYEFPDVDVDRYEVGGRERQVLLSARELSLDHLPDEAKSWSNLHLQYTHGFGIVASLANETTTAGQPDFLVKDLPGTVAPEAESLALEQPRVYFGESFEANEYSVVRSDQREIDFETEDQVRRSTYEGEGGIPIGGYFRRIAFAIRESDPNLVLSSLINPESKMLFYRNVRDRVLRAAPFLALDGDPYPAVVDGRTVWILDAYTSTPWYPYSQRFEMEETLGAVESGALEGSINYVRNSVKVVVDAYDGTMKFYVVDENDPLVRAWRSAFPDLFVDESPSPDLRAHFRYPEDLFDIQSDVFLTYHMTDPFDFYSKQDAWSVPTSAQAAGLEFTNADVEIPPTFLLIQLPGQKGEEFVLTRPFTPRGRNNMIALMAARSDPENYGELLTLEFPRSSLVPGPVQVDNLINQDVEISRTISLLDQRGSDVDFGSLVTLPIEDSILYVQPLFVRAANVGIPELKRVVLVQGERVVMKETFDDALASLFGLDRRPAEQPPPPADGGGGDQPAAGDRLAALVARAGRLYDQAQAALRDGDLEAYARLIDRVGDVLSEADALTQ